MEQNENDESLKKNISKKIKNNIFTRNYSSKSFRISNNSKPFNETKINNNTLNDFKCYHKPHILNNKTYSNNNSNSNNEENERVMHRNNSFAANRRSENDINFDKINTNENSTIKKKDILSLPISQKKEFSRPKEIETYEVTFDENNNTITEINPFKTHGPNMTEAIGNSLNINNNHNNSYGSYTSKDLFSQTLDWKRNNNIFQNSLLNTTCPNIMNNNFSYMDKNININKNRELPSNSNKPYNLMTYNPNFQENNTCNLNTNNYNYSQKTYNGSLYSDDYGTLNTLENNNNTTVIHLNKIRKNKKVNRIPNLFPKSLRNKIPIGKAYKKAKIDDLNHLVHCPSSKNFLTINNSTEDNESNIKQKKDIPIRKRRYSYGCLRDIERNGIIINLEKNFFEKKLKKNDEISSEVQNTSNSDQQIKEIKTINLKFKNYKNDMNRSQSKADTIIKIDSNTNYTNNTNNTNITNNTDKFITINNDTFFNENGNKSNDVEPIQEKKIILKNKKKNIINDNYKIFYPKISDIIKKKKLGNSDFEKKCSFSSRTKIQKNLQINTFLPYNKKYKTLSTNNKNKNEKENENENENKNENKNEKENENNLDNINKNKFDIKTIKIINTPNQRNRPINYVNPFEISGDEKKYSKFNNQNNLKKIIKIQKWWKELLYHMYIERNIIKIQKNYKIHLLKKKNKGIFYKKNVVNIKGKTDNKNNNYYDVNKIIYIQRKWKKYLSNKNDINISLEEYEKRESGGLLAEIPKLIPFKYDHLETQNNFTESYTENEHEKNNEIFKSNNFNTNISIINNKPLVNNFFISKKFFRNCNKKIIIIQSNWRKYIKRNKYKYIYKHDNIDNNYNSENNNNIINTIKNKLPFNRTLIDLYKRKSKSNKKFFPNKTTYEKQVDLIKNCLKMQLKVGKNIISTNKETNSIFNNNKNELIFEKDKNNNNNNIKNEKEICNKNKSCSIHNDEDFIMIKPLINGHYLSKTNYQKKVNKIKKLQIQNKITELFIEPDMTDKRNQKDNIIEMPLINYCFISKFNIKETKTKNASVIWKNLQLVSNINMEINTNKILESKNNIVYPFHSINSVCYFTKQIKPSNLNNNQISITKRNKVCICYLSKERRSKNLSKLVLLQNNFKRYLNIKNKNENKNINYLKKPIYLGLFITKEAKCKNGLTQNNNSIKKKLIEHFKNFSLDGNICIENLDDKKDEKPKEVRKKELELPKEINITQNINNLEDVCKLLNNNISNVGFEQETPKFKYSPSSNENLFSFNSNKDEKGIVFDNSNKSNKNGNYYIHFHNYNECLRKIFMKGSIHKIIIYIKNILRAMRVLHFIKIMKIIINKNIDKYVFDLFIENNNKEHIKKEKKEHHQELEQEQEQEQSENVIEDEGEDIEIKNNINNINSYMDNSKEMTFDNSTLSLISTLNNLDKYSPVSNSNRNNNYNNNNSINNSIFSINNHNNNFNNINGGSNSNNNFLNIIQRHIIINDSLFEFNEVKKFLKNNFPQLYENKNRIKNHNILLNDITGNNIFVPNINKIQENKIINTQLFKNNDGNLIIYINDCFCKEKKLTNVNAKLIRARLNKKPLSNRNLFNITKYMDNLYDDIINNKICNLCYCKSGEYYLDGCICHQKNNNKIKENFLNIIDIKDNKDNKVISTKENDGVKFTKIDKQENKDIDVFQKIGIDRKYSRKLKVCKIMKELNDNRNNDSNHIHKNNTDGKRTVLNETANDKNYFKDIDDFYIVDDSNSHFHNNTQIYLGQNFQFINAFNKENIGKKITKNFKRYESEDCP